MGRTMKKKCGNDVELASVPEGMEALVRGSQKTLDEWKTRSKRNRFRCQNIQVQRIDLSLGLTQLFCENSDYETLRLINGGINLEKKTAIGILQTKIKNLPKKETPHINNSNIANVKTSFAEKKIHSSWPIRGHGSAKWHPLLLKTFEENGGYADTNTLDEIEAVIGGELTRVQITKWFHNRRSKCGIPSGKHRKFSKRAISVLSHVFAKNSGYCDREELDELEETLGDEMTRRQILGWFWKQRKSRGITSAK